MKKQVKKAVRLVKKNQYNNDGIIQKEVLIASKKTHDRKLSLFNIAVYSIIKLIKNYKDRAMLIILSKDCEKIGLPPLIQDNEDGHSFADFRNLSQKEFHWKVDELKKIVEKRGFIYPFTLSKRKIHLIFFYIKEYVIYCLKKLKKI